MGKKHKLKCEVCRDMGWVIWVFPEERPRPAYWFDRGPKGERPSVCECGKVGG